MSKGRDRNKSSYRGNHNTGKRGNFKPDFSEGHKPGKNGNDVSWDKKYPSLVTAASSLIFNTRYGTSLDVVPGAVGSPLSLDKENAIPGVVSLKFRMLLAQSGQDADAVNVCSKNLYSYIRHANSGAANYESSDLMQYVMSVLGIATRLEQAKRTLRLVPTFNSLNRYVYKSILTNMGFSSSQYDEMVANNANYVTQINYLVAKLNGFKIPRDFSVFDRFQWMVTNIFKDDELDKSSYYFYYTDDLIHYDWANRKITNALAPITAYTTFGDYLQSINNELDNLLAYEDIGIMMGDILKAYKQEGCRVWSPMQLGEVQDSSYSLEVLYQFVNTITLPLNDTMEILQITSNSQLLGLKQNSTAPNFGELIVRPEVDASGWVNQTFGTTFFHPELVMNSDEPTGDDLITATRGTLSFEIIDDSYGPTSTCPACKITDYFLYICTNIRFTRYAANGVLANFDTQSFLMYTSSDNISAQNNIIKMSTYISKFPTLYRFFKDFNIDVNIYASGKNNQIVSPLWLKNMHNACTMSELSLPMFKLLESN